MELKTGQVRRKPDLPELVWNGYGHQPTVYAQLQDRLLVDCRAEPYDYVEYGQDGAPYTIHSDRRYLGLITYEDYLSGNARLHHAGSLQLKTAHNKNGGPGPAVFLCVIACLWLPAPRAGISLRSARLPGSRCTGRTPSLCNLPP